MLIALFVLLVLKYLSASASCPDGSQEWQDYCLLFQQNATGFASAEKSCQTFGGNLVSIHDGFFNTLISQNGTHFGLKEVWIGLTNSGSSGNWSWIDGTLVDFTSWGTNEPGNLGNQCAILALGFGHWIAEDCSMAKAFVCNIRKLEPSTTQASTTTRRGHTNQTCPQEYTMNIYLNYFFDVGDLGPRYSTYINILDITANQEAIGTPTRYLTLYAANGNGSHSPLTELTDITSLKNEFAPFFYFIPDSNSRVLSDLTYYQSVLSTQLTYAATPVIVMFLNNPIDDVPTTISKMNALKAADPNTYFMGIFLSTDPTFPQLPFDYYVNITVSDDTAPIIAVSEIFKFVCQVTERTR